MWYESARLIHGRQWPMKGSFYDNIFIHYRPRGDWYKAEYKEEENRSLISLERVKHNQRKMRKTDWNLAWTSYEQHLLNHKLQDSEMFQLGRDPYDGDKETDEYKHLS